MDTVGGLAPGVYLDMCMAHHQTCKTTWYPDIPYTSIYIHEYVHQYLVEEIVGKLDRYLVGWFTYQTWWFSYVKLRHIYIYRGSTWHPSGNDSFPAPRTKWRGSSTSWRVVFVKRPRRWWSYARFLRCTGPAGRLSMMTHVTFPVRDSSCPSHLLKDERTPRSIECITEYCQWEIRPYTW